MQNMSWILCPGNCTCAVVHSGLASCVSWHACCLFTPCSTPAPAQHALLAMSGRMAPAVWHPTDTTAHCPPYPHTAAQHHAPVKRAPSMPPPPVSAPAVPRLARCSSSGSEASHTSSVIGAQDLMHSQTLEVVEADMFVHMEAQEPGAAAAVASEDSSGGYNVAASVCRRHLGGC